MSIFPIITKSALPLRRCAQREHGSVVLAAIVALGTGLVLVLGMITLSNSVLLSGTHTLRLRGAQAMADAGLEYGEWQYAVRRNALPYSNSRSLGKGSFTVQITDNSANIPGSVRVTSTGIMNGVSITRTHVYPCRKTVFDYALCANISLSTNYATIITGTGGKNGDTRCNGTIQLNASRSKINGDAVATNYVLNTAVTGGQYSLSPTLGFPTIDTLHYASIADRSFSSSRTWRGFAFNKPYEVVFVNGDITLDAGRISGAGTLVCTGICYLGGDLTYATNTDKMAVLAVNGIVPTAPCSVVGFYYCHNASNSAYSNANSNYNFTLTSGSLAADNYYRTASSPATYTLVHDPSMNAVSGKNLHLPGY